MCPGGDGALRGLVALWQELVRREELGDLGQLRILLDGLGAEVGRELLAVAGHEGAGLRKLLRREPLLGATRGDQGRTLGGMGAHEPVGLLLGGPVLRALAHDLQALHRERVVGLHLLEDGLLGTEWVLRALGLLGLRGLLGRGFLGRLLGLGYHLVDGIRVVLGHFVTSRRDRRRRCSRWCVRPEPLWFRLA